MTAPAAITIGSRAQRPPRHRLACLPTPLHRLTGAERVYDAGELWIKRDDLTGYALAGNKARPLEYLLGDALAQGCDVLVTGGGPGSNYCQAVAIAAAGAGLGCELVIAGPSGATDPINLIVARGNGARIIYTGEARRDSVDAAISAHASLLSASGRRPYAMPRGGATAVGGLGFADAAAELQRQLDGLGVAPAAVVLAAGSGGTHAGLLAGATSLDVTWEIQGACVSRPVAEMAPRVLDLSRACARLLGGPEPKAGAVQLVDAIGDGFGVAAPSDVALMRQALAADGILLDGTYTAKALRVAIDRARRGAGPVVFWHTGGVVSALAAIADGGVYP